MMEDDDDISEIIKDCTRLLRQRMSPDDTVACMSYHFTVSEKDRVNCINRQYGREPANDEILSIVGTKPQSFSTLAASLKVNLNNQLFEEVCDKVRNRNPGLLNQIECEVRRLDPGIFVDQPQMPKDTALDEKSDRILVSNIELQQTVETNNPKPSQGTLVADIWRRQAQTNSTANLTSEPDERILLDDYNSDLHLCIDSDGYGAEPLTDPVGFSYIWAGVKATHGVFRGKVFYEVKLVKELPIEHGESERPEPHPYGFRVGWSLEKSSLQLGEESDSYGFGSTGKASCSNDFFDYGETYGVGDAVGVFLDFESRPPCLSYTKNGCLMGVAKRLSGYQVGKRDEALFPHILTKNIRFEVNFGQESPWFVPDSGFMSLIQCSMTDRVRGLNPPNKQSLCEVIMIIGLPGAGKTTWAIKKANDNPKKRYNIIGTDLLVEKMKVWGLQRKFNFKERWDQLIPKATKCFNKLLEIACKKKRNYILDQTNVYASARKTKMNKFGGFIRRAAVIVPDNTELTRRSEKRTFETGKPVPEESILRMKTHFKLPWEKDDNFNSIEYTDLPEDKAALLVTSYNMEGKLAQGEMSTGQCGVREDSKSQQTQLPLGFKQGSTTKESSETAEGIQVKRSFSTPSAAEKPVREKITRSYSACPVCSSQILNTSETLEDMELDDVDEKVITRLGEKLSNSSEHDKQLWELVLSHLEVTVTMREKKSIRRSRETGVDFLEMLGDKKVTVGQLIGALKTAGLPEFCKLLPHGSDSIPDRLPAEIDKTEMVHKEVSLRKCESWEQPRDPSLCTEERPITLCKRKDEKGRTEDDTSSLTVAKVVIPESNVDTDISVLKDESNTDLCSPLVDSEKDINFTSSCESQCQEERSRNELETSCGDIKSLSEQPEVVAADGDVDGQYTVQNTDTLLCKLQSETLQQQDIVCTDEANVSNNKKTDEHLPTVSEVQASVANVATEGNKMVPDTKMEGF